MDTTTTQTHSSHEAAQSAHLANTQPVLYITGKSMPVCKVREGGSERWDVSEHATDNCRSSKEQRFF